MLFALPILRELKRKVIREKGKDFISKESFIANQKGRLKREKNLSKEKDKIRFEWADIIYDMSKASHL